MNRESKHPLEVFVAPTGPANHFGPTVMAQFRDHARLSAVEVENGVLIAGVWEPDLDLAATMVHAAFRADVVWGQPKIRYIFEPRILEPILRLEVQTPVETVGNVIGDLSSRRGTLFGMADSPIGHVVAAEVPLAELLGYLRVLESLTNGKGDATATFARYQPAPPWFDPNEPVAMALRA